MSALWTCDTSDNGLLTPGTLNDLALGCTGAVFGGLAARLGASAFGALPIAVCALGGAEGATGSLVVGLVDGDIDVNEVFLDAGISCVTAGVISRFASTVPLPDDTPNPTPNQPPATPNIPDITDDDQEYESDEIPAFPRVRNPIIAQVLNHENPSSQLTNNTQRGNFGEAVGEEGILSAGLHHLRNILPANTNINDTSVLRPGIDGAFTFHNTDYENRAIVAEYKFTSAALPIDSALGFLSTRQDGARQLSETWLRGHLNDLVDNGVIDQADSDLLRVSPRLLAVSDIRGTTHWFEAIPDPEDEQAVLETIRIPNIQTFLNSL